MEKIRIGLLPLYLALYDDTAAAVRPRVEQFARTIAGELGRRGLEVAAAPVCRLEKEFAAAVKVFEAKQVSAIVTLHLAYSPSLESARVLARTRLPVIVLDTTPAWSFGPSQDPAEIMLNHGIHGVQDMCNLLLRNGKSFALEAGHWQRSDVLDRIAALAVPARMAASMRFGKVGLLGTPFKGMGDFSVPPAALKSTIGAIVKPLDSETLKALVAKVSHEEVAAETTEDSARFLVDPGCEAAHERSARFGLALRRWMQAETLSAFSFNFLDMRKKAGHLTVPFLEASKAMARGIGYAGEGDTLTALLVAALLTAYPDSSFTEMFCPDWETGTVFLSHMGELNWRLADGKPRLREMDYPYSRTDNPALLVGRFRPGQIVLANLAPTAQGYRLILAPAEMLPAPGDRFIDSVHGWFRPPLPLAEFLAAYSRAGGTHHLGFSYAADIGQLEAFGRLAGWEILVIR
jgi:L-arabinose isomerase